jgi:hypothetical protein
LALFTPAAGNHHDLYEIETSLGQMFETIQDAEISMNGFFVNADSGFDCKSFREYCKAAGIIANTAFNYRNGNCNDELYLLDELLYIKKGIKLKEPMPGWIASDPYLTGLIPVFQVGLALTISHLL